MADFVNSPRFKQNLKPQISMITKIIFTHQTENPCGLSEAGVKKQLLIVIVGSRF